MKTLIFCIALLLLFQISTHAQHGIDPNWGPEVILPLSNSTAKQRGSLFNNMVATTTGRIIVATNEINRFNPNQVLGRFLVYSDDGGTTWSLTPFTTPLPSVPVKLAMGTNDTLFVLWTTGATSPPAIFVSIYDGALNLIKDSVRVANSQLYGNFATHMTVDRKNRVHVMWHEGNPGTSQRAESFYARSTTRGFSWEPPIPLSIHDNKHSAFPHAEFDVAGDTLLIAWRDSTTSGIGTLGNWDIKGVFSQDGGATWGPVINLVATSDADWDPDVLIDPNGRVHLFYHVYPASSPFWGTHVKYKYSDDLGMTWNNPLSHPTGQISEPGILSQLIEGVRYDSQRNVLWFTWKDSRDFNPATGEERSDMMAAYSLDRGQNWSVPEFVTDRNDSMLGFKAGALLPTGEFCVNYEVWSHQALNDPNGFIRVFFRKRQLVPGLSCDTITSLWTSRIAPTSSRLNWNPVSGVDGYHIRGKVTSLPNWVYVTVAGGATSFLNVSGLTNNTTYHWQIRSLCNSGADSSAWSMPDTFRTGCLPPDSIWTLPVISNAATLNWTRQWGNSGYEIRGRILGASGGTNLLVSGSATQSLNVFGLSPGTNYEWKIRSVCDPAGILVSSYSDWTTFSTPAGSRLENSKDPFKPENELGAFVYPNPVADLLNFYQSNPDKFSFRLVLTDLSGKTILETEELTGEYAGLNVSGLAPGVYILHSFGGAKSKFKIIKE